MYSNHPPELETTALMRIFTRIDIALSRIESVLTYIAVAALFLIMVIVFLDAVLRYAVNRPLNFTADLVTLFLISAGIFAVLSFTMRRGGHISVDLFANMLPRRLYCLVVGAGLLLSAVAVGIMTYELCRATGEAWSKNEMQVGIYSWPMWLSNAIVAVSFLLFEVRLLHMGAANLIAGLVDDARYAIAIASAHEEPMEEPV
jgi:TRAP-type C4-dicarboxylate transport system permease small subunit